MTDIIKNDCQGETFNINTWPETIWLQNENSAPFSSSMFGEICWCHEQINEADVAYVRDDIASAAVKAIRGAELSRLQAEIAEAREIIKSFHLEYVDYSVINHLSGHNNHNVRWARRFLGMKEEWSLDEARAFLKRSDKTESDNV